MRILLTGSHGTLGPKVARVFTRDGATCVGWDRDRVSPDDERASLTFLDEVRPDAIVHLAMGSERWAALLAAWANERGIPFVFTSTAMVFHHEPDGPHHRDDERTARDDYGRYKIRCEDAVTASHPGATIARIGWQIDEDATGNNMLAHLDAWQRERGKVEASRAWRPACSFMTDTASALWTLVTTPRAGAVHLDSNARGGHTFDEVARALARRFDRAWTIEVNEAYAHDQRLVGNERLMPDLADRLTALRGA
ncbi:sugar nucleotide-binding protein [Deinococcus yavapaiensis]|uniref:dTDP-4-dehydrorhamnose reductase n=1 Tax=Deinococcus yavapaiensis KR-236 TaxID=694435 RepID=A0A318S7W4_9DEIO|nr:sugar nucleotide-binding protein [Deinococcus yavapaiensis]PYE55006.1 dTDP-4-dehydrorhamnose reductase [Deinococcus yavapaiensis KR-236]